MGRKLIIIRDKKVSKKYQRIKANNDLSTISQANIYNF